MSDFQKERWQSGESAWFEYHCWESDQSADADLWHRSHQLVTVLAWESNDATPDMTLADRQDAALPYTYTVRFPDGHEGCATEDELTTSRDGWYRPDPPNYRH